ncbi:chemotaxis protein CheB [Colwellia sp. PAMC 20917]|uniref:chemotaxis protein CheB n=1 Tax=Colwellia sp. PAMC 20917 TaxID=1816218 RepID=UPI0008780AC0|nr:chemotaxis protein CheB [Colwellia sp. PAMC 20917]
MKKSKDVVSEQQVDEKTENKTSSNVDVFPIIGIGASAGGLQAIERFLSNVPADCGMAFVVVQHLDPNHKNILCDLLQRMTPLDVHQITDHMVIMPNNVYVIPPAHDLTILNGTLILFTRANPHGLQLPINSFFTSLAADRKEHSIAVILSGMGADGTLGLGSIKDKAGAVFVQSPDTAEFDSMPKNAIDTGLVDAVAPADELMRYIINYVNKVPLPIEENNKNKEDIEKVMVLLRAHTGQDFSLYKKTTINRRVERRMALHQLSNIPDYVRYLRTNPQENELLLKELLIGVTNFFRDNTVWKKLENEVIPSLLSEYPEGGTLRAWVPACSTGEEAYTLSIVFQEAFKKFNSTKHFELQIFATDLDIDAVNKARMGIYSNSISADISKELLDLYFVKIDGGYQIGQQARENVIFAQQNLVMDPPFTKLDIISCRNLLIYLEPELQKKLFPLFHYSLKPSGVLVLGTSETIGNEESLFTLLSGKERIYKRRETSQPFNVMKFPVNEVNSYSHGVKPEKNVPVNPQDTVTMNLENLLQSLLQENFTPAALLTTEKAEVIYINGKTGKYLEPSVGKVNYNLFSMAREGLAAPLNEIFNRAVRLKKKLDITNVEVVSNGNIILVDVRVQPVLDSSALGPMVLVLFTTSTTAIAPIKKSLKGDLSKDHSDEIEKLKNILSQGREELRLTTNEMQLAQENLKSTNEELQSTNEEFQSTNEELTTSKEEMQSMNEELRAVNHELNIKVNELSLARDDLKNLLNSTSIATLFLDNELNVRRFTPETVKIFKLIPSDVGRPITDLVSSLIYPKLSEHTDEVLRSLMFHEEEVTTHDGRWYIVRIMPYRTQETLIDGVVITFSDNTINRNASIAMTLSESRFRLLFENSSHAVAYKNITMEGGKAVDFNYLEVNNAYAGITGLDKVAGKKGSEVVPNILQSNTEFMATCGRVAMSGKSEKFEYYVKESRQWFICAMYSQEQGLFVCVTENITDKKQNLSTLDDIKLMLAEDDNTSAEAMKKMLVNVQNTLEKLLILE